LENHDCSPVISHNNAPCLTWELQGVIMVLFFHCSFDGMLMAKNQELRWNHAVKADEMQSILDGLVNQMVHVAYHS